jgi:hypothetical protein
VLFEDSHGGGKFGGDLADGAIGGEGGHDSIVRSRVPGVGDWSHGWKAMAAHDPARNFPAPHWVILS